ncbi:hypothetical protein FE697_001100 [Mumia zhuanghuii]|uniref:Uncharacterized protein n=2 Tax=Mumia TaxID=1546255 RepID=A0ABW1QFX5_9ACTN|nr:MULTISPECIES: hypothetical protein [Mumia]KAA1424556.1 hypothetical protein FE697_001100 [Mumia zhuanghuii]
MLVLRLIAANCALVAAWLGTLFLLGFRAIPMQLGLLALGIVTSSMLVSKAILERERRRVPVDAGPESLATAEA